MRWERGDLTDEAAARDLVRRVRPDVVLHLASEVSGGRDLELVLPMLRANLLAAVNVMVACAERAARASSWPARWRSPTWATRTPSPSPRTRSRSGARSRTPAISSALHELPVVHLRVFMVYGPGQLDLRKLVPYVTVSLLRGEAPRLTSGARAVDWIYVDDVVDAFLRAAVAPGLEGRSLDVGSGELVTARALVVRLRELVGGDVEPGVRGDPGPAARARPGGRSRAAAEAMGWRPQTSSGGRAGSDRGLLPLEPRPAAAGLRRAVVPRFSVLIPTHGDADLLRKSLPVLLADLAADIEVIVINNDPQQDVRRAIGEHASDVRTTIVEMGYEGDFPRAINRGIELQPETS